jgi:transposase InsO family protein
MPWGGSLEEDRAEFLRRFGAEGANRRELCALWDVSPKTAYKWYKRYVEGGASALADRSRRPHNSPRRTSAEVEEAILALRDEQPAWGPRKLWYILRAQGRQDLPAISTVAAILKRNGKISEEASQKRKAYRSFEREHPNELWQMDFKGHFGLLDGSRCHPLMLLDDHSRYCLGSRACGDQRGQTVKWELVSIFRTYGLPEAMLMDNGSPWGNDPVHVFTPLVVWLLRLQIKVLHGRPRHPQTQGKLERLNRTTDDELLSQAVDGFANREVVQSGYDRWRPVYNYERPHESLNMQVPASRYTPSERRYPNELPPIEYDEADVVRKVQDGGRISFGGREYRLPKAFRGNPVALRPTEVDGLLAVYFCHQRIAVIDLKGGTTRPVRR